MATAAAPAKTGIILNPHAPIKLDANVLLCEYHLQSLPTVVTKDHAANWALPRYGGRTLISISPSGGHFLVMPTNCDLCQDRHGEEMPRPM
jgi:hypothetical protein